ncbi:MAG: hypothetical protein JNJ54_12050 [Myxococcaceae bacterium]|nr:hypothetical protein [Myxococcaceae bacterium]
MKLQVRLFFLALIVALLAAVVGLRVRNDAREAQVSQPTGTPLAGGTP